MSKFTVGKRYVSHNHPDFTMRIKSRGTKYISGTISYTDREKVWSPALRKWVIDVIPRRYSFEKLKYNKNEDSDDVWVYFEEYGIRVGFKSD